MNQYERKRALTRRRDAIARKLLLTLALFSWPGLLVAHVGNQNGDVGLVLGGLAATCIVWGIYLLPMYKDWVQAKKTLRRRHPLKHAH